MPRVAPNASLSARFAASHGRPAEKQRREASEPFAQLLPDADPAGAAKPRHTKRADKAADTVVLGDRPVQEKQAQESDQADGQPPDDTGKIVAQPEAVVIAAVAMPAPEPVPPSTDVKQGVSATPAQAEVDAASIPEAVAALPAPAPVVPAPSALPERPAASAPPGLPARPIIPAPPDLPERPAASAAAGLPAQPVVPVPPDLTTRPVASAPAGLPERPIVPAQLAVPADPANPAGTTPPAAPKATRPVSVALRANLDAAPANAAPANATPANAAPANATLANTAPADGKKLPAGSEPPPAEIAGEPGPVVSAAPRVTRILTPAQANKPILLAAKAPGADRQPAEPVSADKAKPAPPVETGAKADKPAEASEDRTSAILPKASPHSQAGSAATQPAAPDAPGGDLKFSPPANPAAAGIQSAPSPHATAPTSTMASPGPTPAPVPLVGVAMVVVANVHAGRNHFEIRLDPPELGRIDVRLHFDSNGHVTSHLVVDRSDTLDLLRRDAADLDRSLQQAGLKTADNGMQFSLRDQSAGNDNGGSERTPAAQAVVREAEPAAEIVMRGYIRAGQGAGVDIRV